NLCTTDSSYVLYFAAHFCSTTCVHTSPYGAWRSAVSSSDLDLTAAYLDLKVTRILARSGISRISAVQQRHLAAVVHLCGAGAGRSEEGRGGKCGGLGGRLSNQRRTVVVISMGCADT